MTLQRHKTQLMQQNKQCSNNNNNNHNKHKSCPPLAAKWGNICTILLCLLLLSSCQLGRAQQQKLRQGQQQQALPPHSELEAVELLQDNDNNNNNDNDNDIEFASLDGATQLLPATRHGGDATAAPPSTPALLLTSSTSSYTELQGGEILSERTLRLSESPYLARDDLEVVRGARLTIEPGVTVEFAPTKGLKVRGVLQAVVSGNKEKIEC